MAVCIAAGAIIAATDALNDELWNPAYFGSPFVAACLPCAFLFGMPAGAKKRWVAVIVAATVAAILVNVIRWLGVYLVVFSLSHGIPAGW